ncbi:hypothetical protein [Desulfobacula phenolica]|uniref:Uncharacterized protein n=1 Tax=Desulfobacula phenolica TaxID=90732 RepID=A0A1H2J9Z2_9BACT|nr:hypothetical protein [Desulfobacula phenolica]SDU53142.1 hypothetical protein SAMN04487931_11182 [Desulfobacula phenolica]
MSENQKPEYNPVITGFSGNEGPLNISLTDAKKKFGQLPSKYGFVSAKKDGNKNRSDNKSLNLKTGRLIRDLLSDKKKNLKKKVYQFFQEWHRDLKSEFKVDIIPFFNINDPAIVKTILNEDQECLNYFSGLDIKRVLSGSGLIRKDVLNSIRPHLLLEKTSEILTKKIRNGSGKQLQAAKKVLDTLNCYSMSTQIKQFSDDTLSLPKGEAINCFADEISHYLLKFNASHPLSAIHCVAGITGKGIEFEYATRDYSYLELGKITGDCTADKRNFQSDRNIENIFWTVFSWILDKNYQIVKVFFEGEFVMKVHLLPLYVTGPNSYGIYQTGSSLKSDYTFLAIDAVETTFAFRDHQASSAKSHLIKHKDEIFFKTIEFIEKLADDMNIENIYAEKFSNTPWIRDIYGTYPEIFFHVDHLEKIDQLEDVFSLADEISTSMGYGGLEEIFMELQMKNTCLSPGYINKAPGVKSFALVRGDAGHGIPMKRIIGI